MREDRAGPAELQNYLPTARPYRAGSSRPTNFALYNELTHDEFERALETTPHITEGNLYATNLAQWYATFGKERVLVLLFEGLRDLPQAYIDRVCEFVGVPRIDLSSLKLRARAVNAHSLKPRNPSLARKGRRAMNWLRDRKLDRAVALLDRVRLWKLCFEGEFPRIKPATERTLRERYLPEIEALETLIDRDLSAWKVGPNGAAESAWNADFARSKELAALGRWLNQPSRRT